MTRRQYQIYIDRLPEQVWAFHTDLSNHPQMAPPGQQEQVLRGFTSPLKHGARVVFRARHGGGWRTLEAQITEWEPPSLFVSRQVKGPFAAWTHRHKFSPFQHGTLMTDQIEYRAPFGVFGRIADWVWLRKHLDRTFAYRQQAAKRLLEQAG